MESCSASTGRLRVPAYGIVELYKFSSFLAKSYEVLDVLFSIFEEIGLIKILERSPNTIKIQLDETVSYTKSLHSQNYQTLINLISDCEEFLQILVNQDIDRVQELFEG